MILRAYQERASMRGVERIFGTVRQTLARWIREKAANLPAMETTSWLLSQTRCWIWMSYGHFCAQSATNAGSGLPSVVAPARSSPASSAAAAPTGAGLCAISSPKTATLVVPAAHHFQGGAMPANCFSDQRGLAAVSTKTGKGGCSHWSNEVQSQEGHAWYGLSRGCDGLFLTTFYQKETRK